MADISKIKSAAGTWNIKDATARSRMIDNTTDSDVKAIVNFLNGLKVDGKTVITQATADVTSIDADQDPSVDVDVTTTGAAHFSFSIPKAKSSYVSVVFNENSLIFNNDGEDYCTVIAGDEVVIGRA